MNTIKKAMVGIASSAALVSAIALGPVAASASGPDGGVSGQPAAAQSTSAPTPEVRTESPKPTAPPGGDGINRSIPGLEGPGEPPLIEYGSDGRMTQDSARRLLAKGWRATDGSELEEIASGNHGGPAGGSAPQGKSTPGTGAPRTGTTGTGTLPRVAG